MQCMDAPTRPSAWEGVLDCTTPGNVCPQVRMLSTPCIRQVFENQIGCWKSTRQFPGWIWGPLWQLHWQRDWFWGLPQPQCLLHPIRGEVWWSKEILPGYVNWVKLPKVWPKNWLHKSYVWQISISALLNLSNLCLSSYGSMVEGSPLGLGFGKIPLLCSFNSLVE